MSEVSSACVQENYKCLTNNVLNKLTGAKTGYGFAQPSWCSFPIPWPSSRRLLWQSRGVRFNSTLPRLLCDLHGDSIGQGWSESTETTCHQFHSVSLYCMKNCQPASVSSLSLMIKSLVHALELDSFGIIYVIKFWLLSLSTAPFVT
jgi:hypothetical protein